jgi:cellulose synthase/poly-beta-1,6-N-acetylglucosamine synthase-like glycosyltransferase
MMPSVLSLAFAGGLLLAAPEAPRSRVDVSPPAVSGATRHVARGADLQEVLDAAQPGDEIVLPAGETFTGPFVLPAKSGTGWISIRSDAPPSLLPPGVRVRPALAGWMAKLESAVGPVLTTEAGAHHYRLVGLELRPRPGAFLMNLVLLGLNESTLAELPHHIVFDRCYLHGDPSRGSRRGIALNGAHLAVINSFLADFKEESAESQALAGWNGSGPFLIENDTLEAAGENVLFGGADPRVPGLVPSDIEVLRNHIRKPLSWREGQAGYAGTHWMVKNLLELKNARRVRIAGNLLENNWAEAQNGFAVLFTPRNQEHGAPWSAVEDVVFEDNRVRHVGGGINVLGHDDNAPSQGARRIAIRNSLFEDVGEGWGGRGTLLQLLEGADDVEASHLTALQSGSIVVAEGAPHSGFVLRDTIVSHNEYGLIGTGTAPGQSTLERYFPGGVFRGNVIVGGAAAALPSGNRFPANLDDVGFVGWRQGDYHLGKNSPYRGAASDGNDVGADVDALPAPDDEATLLVPAPPAPPPAPAAGRGLPVAAVGFWFAVLLLGYIHLGYPLLLRLWAAGRRRPVQRAPVEPLVSVVVVAHNEGDRIDSRLSNLLALDYAPGRSEIILASDGSSDDTVARARAYEDAGVRVLAFPLRRGKPSVLDEVVPACRGEIVVLADARQSFDPGALRALVAPFADPTVGAVSGELVLQRDGDVRTVGEGVGFYWRWEKAIRAAESALDSMVGATGAIYAIRRELFEPIPADTVLDDGVVPLHVVRRGYRVVFEPGARAYDRPASSAAEEMSRKVRTIAGCFQLFWREPWLLVPFRNRLWLQTLSHKALRLLTPLLLGAALLANLTLALEPFYFLLLLAQGCFYGAAFLGFSLRGRRGTSPFLSVPCVFCLLAWATVLGFARFMGGRQAVTWQRATPAGSH